MTDYAKKAKKVADKFAKEGQPAALRRIVYGDYDPDTGGPAVVSDTAYPCFVMSFDYDLQGSGVSNAPDSLIQAGDKQILLPAYGLPFEPAPDDQIIVGAEVVSSAAVGGVTWVIKNVKGVNPTGIPVLYELNGRK